MKKLTHSEKLSNKPHHYVYKISHLQTGEFYVGMRSSAMPFEYDTDYFSSSPWIKDKDKSCFIKELLETLDSRESARKYEGLLINKFGSGSV